MLFADIMSGPQLTLLGFTLALVALLMRRSAKRVMKSKNRDVLSEVQSEMRDAERSHVAAIQRSEVRVYDFHREVQGRVDGTLALLEELVAQADKEIDRLEQLLEGTRPAASPHPRRPDITDGPAPMLRNIAGASRIENGFNESAEPALPNADDRRMARHLYQAGFHADEIADCLQLTVNQVEAIIADDRQQGLADAA